MENSPQILFVEDFDIQRSIYEAMAALMQVELTFATSGKTALESVAARAFDLVVLDWNLPDMNGLECAQKLRAYWSAQGVKAPKVVCMTACPVEDEKEGLLVAGLDDYVGKPFGIEEFSSILNGWLEV